MLTSVVVVPSTPLVLDGHPGQQHEMIAELGRQIDRAIGEIAGSDTVVVLAGGPLGSGIRVRTHGDVDRSGGAMCTGYGIASSATSETSTTVAPRSRQADRIAAAARIISRHTHTLPATSGGWADAEVLAVQAARVAPTSALILVSVAPDSSVDDVMEVAAPISRDEDSRTALLVAGDLSAGHGTKPPRPGATIVLDDQVLGALDGGQPERLLRVSEELALDSQSRAIGALRLLGAVLADTRLGTAVRWSGAPLGVGYVVAVGR